MMLSASDKDSHSGAVPRSLSVKYTILICSLIAILSAFIYWIMPETQTEKVLNEKASSLFTRFWNWRLRESPEFATFIGCHDFDDKLESYSLDDFKNRQDECRKFRDEAMDLMSDEELDENTRSNLYLFAADITAYLKGSEAKGYLFPINNLEGVQVEFERLVNQMKYDDADDYRKLISRLKAFPHQMNEIIELMKEGIRLKMTNHALSMSNVIKQLDQLQVDSLENSVFFKPALSMPANIDEVERTALKTDIKKAISDDVLPSFNKLKIFLETEYFNNLRPNESISSLPDGEDFYMSCLRFHLSLSMTPEEVHELGLEEVRRIEKEIDKVIQKLFISLPRKEFAHKMKDDKDSYFKTEDELLDVYKGIVVNQIKPKLPKIIKKIPTLELLIQPTPPSMSSGPAAYYLAGTPDGRRPGVFYVNTAEINASPKYETMTLALHEAEPGHHLQISYMMQMGETPSFRQYIEDRKYSDAPSRFPLHTSYIEGWGLYSEYLGYELGLYEDPFLEYGHLSHEMFRACRLVVDTGIHYFGWTKERAVNYLLEKTALHQSEIEKEVDRYITWPGQACAYKIGEIKIKELRRKTELALGSAFDVCDFHDVILKNAGPLDMLEKKINEYIHLKIVNVASVF